MTMKVSDYIFDFLKQKEIDVAFTVSGGASAHLLDSLSKYSIKYICNAHEQACAMAAEGYAKVNNKPAIVLVTNGPGSTNTITGVLGAYQDSTPMIVISGQVPGNQSMASLPEDIKLRQVGVQECDIISIVTSITNYAATVRNAKDIAYILDEAYYRCMTGRMGPVWIEVPIDIQSQLVDIDTLSHCNYPPPPLSDGVNYDMVLKEILSAKRPLIVAGNGIHLSKTEHEFIEFVNTLHIPVVTSWTSKDLFSSDDKNFIGTFGIIGERAGNFAIQNADLLIVLGNRLSIPHVGYQTKSFAPNARKIMVDIDSNEIKKPTISIDVPVNTSLSRFFPEINPLIKNISIPDWSVWSEQLNSLKVKYHVYKEDHKREEGRINSFDFMKTLSTHLKNEIVVTDMGTSYTCTMQALQMNGDVKLFTSSACCSMGFGLPGAIGSIVNEKRPVICIAGDGGFQMNIQELQTIVHYKLPIKIFILNNNGYLAISLMQDNLFNKNYVGCNKQSGVSSPSFVKIAAAYNIKSYECNSVETLTSVLPEILSADVPVICEVHMIENQLLIPRVQSKKDADGKIVSATLDNMFPFLQMSNQ